MSRLALPLILFLAYVLMIGGCGSSQPLSPSARCDDSGHTIGVGTNNERPGNFGLHPGVDIRDLPQYAEGEVVIVLHDGTDAAALYPMAKKLGLSLIQEIKLMWANVYRMRIDDGESVESMVAALSGYPEVRYAEPNYIMYPCAAPYYPNDPLFEFPGDPDDDPWNYKYDQWGPNVLGASLCWPISKGDPNVAVAVLDTGYRYTHEDLANQIWINEDEIPGNGIDDDGNDFIDDWRGWDFWGEDNDPWDPVNHGHGTACSGVVAAEQDNGVGCTGIAPGCKVMALRCDLMSGGMYTTSVIGGIQYAYDNGATAVSMSFRTYNDSDIMHNTFIAAYDGGNGLLPVGGAGNENSTDLTYPACWPEVVEVGGTCSFYNSSGTRRDVQRIQPNEYGWGSNWGVNLEVMAPGYLYVTTHVAGDDQYWDGVNHGTFGGTSCATPCAAACFGLLKSAYPDMTAAQLRQRMNETCDDLYTPGHDIQSGWGRVNIWRAIYGSDPNEDIYDPNGHIPLSCDDTWQYDNIFDISTSADYDYEDVFVIEADDDGLIKIDMDIITTGEDLDMELYVHPGIGTPIADSTGPNGETRPLETIYAPVSQGQKFYVRVYSPEPYNCSSYRVRAHTEPHLWWIEWQSLAPIFVLDGSDAIPILKLEIYTNLLVTLREMRAYIAGDTPLGLVNHLWLYEDTNDSGNWEPWQDTIAGTATPSDGPVNQAVFDNILAVSTYEKPLRYFLIGDVGPNDLGYNVKIGVGFRTYKDITIWQDVPLSDDPFPIFSNLTVVGQDHDPPVWDDTVGIQLANPSWESAYVYWNNGTDELNEPTTYNVYWDDEFPPEISTGMMIENIVHWDGGDYDHAGKVPNLENDKAYYFCVRAQDTLDNEDDNEIWLEATPGPYSDPENPVVVGELNLSGDSWEVWVHDKIAYVANGDAGIAIVDCHIPDALALVDTYPALGCYGIQYHEGQGYVYASTEDGFIIVDPDAPGGPELIGSNYQADGASDVFVDGNTCYVGTWIGRLYVFDVTDPTLPEHKGDVSLGNNQSIYGIAARDGYAYCCTVTQGLKIVDATTPTNPHVVKTLTLNNYTYENTLWGDYLFVTNWWGHRLHVVDITDPPNAFRAGTLDFSGGYGAGVAVRDNTYVYMGRYPNAVWTVDWSDLEDIHPVGSAPTDGPDGLFFDGDYLYAAENEDGLKVIL